MDVARVAKLANLPLTSEQTTALQSSLDNVITLVDEVQKLDTTSIEPTSQVTGLVNVTRPDVIDTSRMLTQEEALANAPSSQNGYFKVPAVL